MHLFSTKKIHTFILIPLSIMIIYSLPLICDAMSLKTEETRKNTAEEVKKQLQRAVDLINKGLYRDAEKILLSFENNISWQGRVFFLLGRLYKEEGSFEKAKNYLKKAVTSYPLLRDYALKLLIDVYVATGEFDKAIETVRQVKNELLLQKTRESEITALLALKREKEAKDMLFQFIEDYPMEWDAKFTLALLLKTHGETDKAIHFFKDIYINAVPLSVEALKELRLLKADVLTREELLKRADKLFEQGDFQGAKATYNQVLKLIDKSMKDKVRFAIGLCQFNLKQYVEAAKTFELIKNPKALYWQARAFYRVDDREGVNRVIKKFEKDYPKDKRLAKLLLALADDFRRRGDLNKVEKILKKVLKTFPEMAEDVFWGIGWINYTVGNYKTALKYFSKLTTYVNSKNYYKYLYWRARSKEKLANNTVKSQVKSNNFFDNLPSDESYYGYLIKFRSSSYTPPDRLTNISKPAKPEGEIFDRIEALAFLGMKPEAVNEIIAALKERKNKEDFLYLGYMAMKMQEYKRIVAIAEATEDETFLPFSYPLAYWDVVKHISKTEGLDPYLVVAVIREESRFDPMAISRAGAIGLMQIMPSTALRLKDVVKVNLNNTLELHNITENILLGTYYLSQLIKEFKKIPFALAAYNAGENALRDWLFKFNNKDIDEFIEDIPYRETRRYVKKVLRSYWQYRTINGLPIEGF